jgi:hypothetical protein
MPYIKKEDRPHIIEKLKELVPYINSKGDFNYTVCQLLGELILGGKIGYTEISNWIDTLDDAEAEARRILLNPYEDRKIIENGMVESWIEIINKINVGFLENLKS